ncbi:hypothetical protein [Streptomyces sp. NPDC127108]|uniref:hypothetical protein n=1 Tax=Streptomyces sp. NPDC127108 TaxID=3345361 RepID=UPI00362EEAA1
MSAQTELRSSIPWKKRGSGKVRRCARHGKLNTWGYTDKLTLKNRCGRKFTYHLEIKSNPDRCVSVKKRSSKKVTWNYPGKLVKVRNGRVGGRC